MVGSLASAAYAEPFTHPHRHQPHLQRMHERRQRPYVIGQLLALVAQRLNLGLGRRIGKAKSFPPTCNGQLGSHRFGNGGGSIPFDAYAL
jgi:hypothetical protein